jgi:hypothetical protein
VGKKKENKMSSQSFMFTTVSELYVKTSLSNVTPAKSVTHTSGRRRLRDDVGTKTFSGVGHCRHPELVLAVRLQVLDGDPADVGRPGVLVVAPVDHVRMDPSVKKTKKMILLFLLLLLRRQNEKRTR